MAKQLCYHKLQSKNIQNLFVQACNLATVCGKILKGENFGESMPLKLLAGKILANLPVVDQKILHMS